MNATYNIRNDRKSREALIMLRGDALICRKIQRKIIMSAAFKEKYPVADEIDYSRHQNTLLSWLNSIDDILLWSSRVFPTASLIFENKRYFFSKSGETWVDNYYLKYWSARLDRVNEYDRRRSLSVVMSYNSIAKTFGTSLNQWIVETPFTIPTLEIYRNNDLIWSYDFPTVSTPILSDHVVAAKSELNAYDIYCLKYGDKHAIYLANEGTCNEIWRTNTPKEYCHLLDDFEKIHGEPYRFSGTNYW